MNEQQGDQIIDLLSDILSELRDLRTNFDEFTGYNVYKMSVAIDDITDRITGGIGGIGGASLEEVKGAVEAVESAVDLK